MKNIRKRTGVLRRGIHLNKEQRNWQTNNANLHLDIDNLLDSLIEIDHQASHIFRELFESQFIECLNLFGQRLLDIRKIIKKINKKIKETKNVL
jgi:hypothetical protein